MRRLTYFVLLGPLLSWLVFLAMLTPKLLTGPRFDGGLQFFFIALLICYVPGAVGFFLMAGIDHLLSRYRRRWIPCAAIGFAIAFGLFYWLSRGGPEKDFQDYWIFLGLMGGLPTALCSWLADKTSQRNIRQGK